MQRNFDTPGSFEGAFGSAIVTRNLLSILPTPAELALDRCLPDGLLKDIPFFGSLVNVGRFFHSYREYLFARKVAGFLRPIAQVDPALRQDFIRRLRDAGKFHEFSETVVLLLDKMDHLSKAPITGAIMEAHLRGKVTYEQALRLCMMVERAYLPDLLYLREFKNGAQREHTPIAAALFSVGFVSHDGLHVFDEDDPLAAGLMYSLNIYGTTLLEIRALDFAG